LEVSDVSYPGPNVPAWQQLGSALWEVLAVVGWTLIAGLIATGGCWYLGQFLYTDWVREHPPPRLRFLAERRLRRDFAHGFSDLEKYLREGDPARASDRAARPGRSWTWRHQGGL
jgi:hypothetical protein